MTVISIFATNLLLALIVVDSFNFQKKKKIKFGSCFSSFVLLVIFAIIFLNWDHRHIFVGLFSQAFWFLRFFSYDFFLGYFLLALSSLLSSCSRSNQFLLLGKRVFRTFPIHLVSVQISNNLIAKLESRLIFLYFCTYKDIFKLFGHSCIENKD